MTIQVASYYTVSSVAGPYVVGLDEYRICWRNELLMRAMLDTTP